MDPASVQTARVMFHLEEGRDEEEINDVMNIIMHFEGPEDIFPMCVKLKEEGNQLFKKRLFDKALNYYVRATKMLCFAELSSKKDETIYCELATSLNLNLSHCFININLFSPAKDICSLVLEFDPNNVKALYRRALSWKGINRLEEAMKDLSCAARGDPKNPDILREIDSMKESVRINPNGKVMAREQCGLMNPRGKRAKAYSQESYSSAHGLLSAGTSSPVGLGVGLPPIKRRAEDLRGNDVVDGVREIGQGYLSSEQEQCTTNATDLVMEVSKPEESGISSCDKQGAPSMSSHGHNFSNHGNVADLAEPKFRFQNRRRRGSIISTSKKNYERLARGKSFHYFDPRSGSYIVVKVVRPLIDEPASSNSVFEKGTRSQEEEHEVTDVTNERCSTTTSPNNNPSDVERKEEVNCSTEITNVSSSLSSASSISFNFICKSKVNSRRQSRGLITRKAFRQWNLGKRRRMIPSSAAFNTSTNMFSSCRSQIGKKRKIVNSPISDPPHYQKKFALNSSYYTYSSNFTFVSQGHELSG